MAKNETSGPVRHSSMTSRSPAAPNLRSRIASTTARFGGWPDPRRSRRLCRPRDRRPSARPESRTRRRASTRARRPTDSQVRKRAVGTPWRAMNAFANALLDSRRAAAAVGPNSEPAVRGEAIGDAEAQRQFRTDDGEVDLLAVGERSSGVGVGEIDAARCGRARQYRDSRARTTISPTSRSEASLATSACSRAPLPRTRTLMI